MSSAGTDTSVLELLIFDLESSSRMVRLSAISQIQRFLDQPGVSLAIQARLEVEDDPECLQFLLYLKASQERKQVAGSRVPPAPVPQAEGSLSERFIDSAENQLDSVAAEIAGLPDGDRQVILAELLSRRTLEAIKVLALLDLADRHYSTQLSNAVMGVVRKGNLITAVKAFHILVSRDPKSVAPHLPALLIHPALTLRIGAIRLLHRISPSEAIRLLDEFLEGSDIDSQTLALGLMFTLPFEDVSAILFQLIEGDRLPPKATEMVENLVRSNPDKVFLARLAGLSIRRRGEVRLLDRMINAAAEAISLSGIDPRPPRDLIQSAVVLAEERLSKLQLISETNRRTQLDDGKILGGPSEKPSISARVPGKQTSTPLPGTQPSRREPSPVAHREDPSPELPGPPPPSARRESPAAGETAGEAQNLQGDEEILAQIRLAAERKMKDPAVLKSVEGYLDHPQERVKIAAMKFLADTAPRVITPHLPVLCCNSSPLVATQAVRILRRLEGSGFLRRVQGWLSDPTPVSRNAALVALMQVDFNQARSLILRNFEHASDVETIKSLGAILQVNPERRTIQDLQRLVAKVPKSRQQIFLDIAGEIERSLGEIAGARAVSATSLEGAFSEMFGEKLEEFLEKIRNVHYRVGEGLGEGVLGSPEPILKALAILVGIVAIFVSVRWLFPGPDPFSDVGGKGVEALTIPRPSVERIPKEGETLLGSIEGIDPFNQTVKIKTRNGEIFKVMGNSRIRDLKIGDRMEVLVASAATTPLGFRIIDPKSFRKVP